MRDFLITDRAFELPPLIKVSPEELRRYLQTRYGQLGDPCYDFGAAAYDSQMKNLVDCFYGMVDEYAEVDPELVWQVKENFSNLQYPSGTLEERKRYFKEVKENLEEILFLLKSRDPAWRAAFIIDLGEQIADCGPGAYTQIAFALYDLKSQDTVPFWVANLRKNNLQIFGEQHVARKFITNTYSMHVHVVFGKFAAAQGWGIPPANRIASLPDQYEEDAWVEEEDLRELQFKFERGMHPEALVNAVYVNVHALLHDYQYLDLTVPITLESFTKAVKPFTQHKIFNMSILVYDERSRRTRIQAEFWSRLRDYCEQLLVKERIIFGKTEIQAERTKALKQLRAGMEDKNTLLAKSAAAAALLPDIKALGYFLFWLPPGLAQNLLQDLEPEYLATLARDRYELLFLLYQLTPEMGEYLIWCLGKSQLRKLFSGAAVFLLQTIVCNPQALSRSLLGCLPRTTWKDQACFDIYQQVLSVLVGERERLKRKYGPISCPRTIALEETIFKILCALDEAEGERVTWVSTQLLKSKIRWAIQENLINRNLDKYKAWGMKLGLMLLNVLLVLPVITVPIKRLATGTWFFSLKGKSHEAGKRAVQNLNRMMTFW